MILGCVLGIDGGCTLAARGCTLDDADGGWLWVLLPLPLAEFLPCLDAPRPSVPHPTPRNL